MIADDTDEPVANARVSAPLAGVGTPVVLTDDDGRFTLTIPAGATRLAASKTGYGRSDMPVTAGRQTVDIRLQRAAAVSGRVVDDAGEPIQGARVTARNATAGSDDAAAAAAVTDDRGETASQDLRPDVMSSQRSPWAGRRWSVLARIWSSPGHRFRPFSIRVHRPEPKRRSSR